MRRRMILSLLYILMVSFCFGQSKDLYECVKMDWDHINSPEVSIIEISECYNLLSTKYKNSKKALLYNDLFFILNLSQNAKTLTTENLQELPSIEIDDPLISGFMGKHSRILSDYYTLKWIKSGRSYEESKSGMTFNTSYGGMLRDIDYQLMEDVFSSDNEELKGEFLKIIHFSIRYNGLTEPLLRLRPIIERNVIESDSKKELMDKYKSYEHLMPGKSAPDFVLKDFNDVQYKLSDYKGKVVVIDVWATWCSGCIKKLPDFLETRAKYKGREDVVFMVISIDVNSMYNKWKFAHPKYKLLDITSLIASKEICNFEKDYNITGIPRYMIIDKGGNIVSVYAPAPGNGLTELIETTLSNNSCK